MNTYAARNMLRCTAALFVAVRGFAALSVLLLLCSCITSDSERRAALAPVPPSYGQIPQNSGDPSYAEAAALNAIRPALGVERGPVAGGAPRGAVAFSARCDLKDRFDRDLTLAYRFSDGRAQLGLDVDSDLWAAKFEGVKIAFRYKLQKPGRAEKAACLYNSPVQGLIGSAYNELVERDTDTVWDFLEDRGF